MMKTQRSIFFRALLVAWSVVLLAGAACVPAAPTASPPVPTTIGSDPTTTPAPATPVASPTPVPVPSATPAMIPSPTTGPDPQQVLSQAASKLSDSIGYRFTVSATLSYSMEQALVEWRYAGQGAFAAPDSYEWAIEGQADVMMHQVSVGGKSNCADTRGPLPVCSLAWGGPSPGTSPYTVITYTRNLEKVGDMEKRSLDGKDHYYLTFVPSLAKVAALDSSHLQAVASLSGVTGQAWIDPETGLLRRERIIANYSPPTGAKHKVDITLAFFDYGKPVEIKLPAKPQ